MKQNQGALSVLYDGKSAPHIAAKGYSEVADLIIARAKEEGLLIHKDEQLFNYLQQMDIGQKIPPTMYVVIAELIAFSYVLRGKFPDSWQ
ncbi:MAG: EscU/YscU/HrcU family type III secretion system export apparatus switch protein [Gammaproteobacteria bacterium]|nr:EscU/YscU/HrcU family type III secretion system export apparatus switch protein [Gammaproteobacteria bacterium]